MTAPTPPVAVIGAGPVGLAAAAHLIARNVPVKVYEAGESIATHVREWGHVRLFSPWRLNVDAAARAILTRNGWQEPPGDALPTGNDLYHVYLQPLANAAEMDGVIELSAHVQAVSRQGMSKVVTSGREQRSFALAVRNGRVRVDEARAVIDASGTWRNPNPLGATGFAAVGEPEAADCIDYGIPDVLGADRARYAGNSVLVVGAGHSAANVLIDLARLAEADPRTALTWAVRGENARVFGGTRADQLVARGRLGRDVAALAASGRSRLVTRFAAHEVVKADGGIMVGGLSPHGVTQLGPFDRIVVATGQRPDLAMTRELRLDLHPWLECPKALGSAIDPNLHSCGTVPPHGYRELAHPEPGYFAVGMKSYGRAPTFLMATGYEQVRSIAAFLAGDVDAANAVQLVLPETGACVTDLPRPPSAKARESCSGIAVRESTNVPAGGSACHG